jgi:hypothetical protein
VSSSSKSNYMMYVCKLFSSVLGSFLTLTCNLFRFVYQLC